MKRGTPNHRKMHRLARRLRVSLAEAVGTMELLWHWVAEYLPRGDIGRSEDWEIASAVHWTKDPEELVRALVEEHWLDEHPTCRLVVHDWPEHCEENVHTKLARARDFFADGSKPRLGKLGGAERTSAEEFYGAVIASDVYVEEFTLPKQPVSPLSADPKTGLNDSTEETLTQGRDVRAKGPQKDLAKPSLAKPSLIASERKKQEQSAPLARLDSELVSARLHRFMGTNRKPDGEIVEKIAAILEGHPIETLDAFLQSLNGRKIKSYGFFPTVLRREIANITAPQPPHPEPIPEPTPEPEEQAIEDYYRWRLQEIKRLYVGKYGEEMYRKHLKTQEKELMKEYPSVAIMPKPDRETLAERRFLNELSNLPEMQVARFGDYKAKVRSTQISAVGVSENANESKEPGKLATAGGF